MLILLTVIPTAAFNSISYNTASSDTFGCNTAVFNTSTISCYTTSNLFLNVSWKSYRMFRSVLLTTAVILRIQRCQKFFNVTKFQIYFNCCVVWRPKLGSPSVIVSLYLQPIYGFVFRKIRSLVLIVNCYNGVTSPIL